MGDKKSLEIPFELYNYVLYHECANKDWVDTTQKAKISPNIDLRNYINWNSTYTVAKYDKGGATLFGCRKDTWENFVNTHKSEGWSLDVNKMGRNGWHRIIKYFWEELSYANLSANYACAFTMFQMVWGGFGYGDTTLKKLKEKCDNKNYPFITKGNTMKKIADATHAFSNPMEAYVILTDALPTWYNNISGRSDDNWHNRCGWFNRSVLSFGPDALYVPVKSFYLQYNLDNDSPLDKWFDLRNKLTQTQPNGYVKLFNWDATAEQITAANEKMGNSSFSPSSFSPYFSGGSSSSTYSCFGVVNNMGDYTNCPDGNNIPQEKQNREEVWNTLIGGSYMQDKVRKCAELITTDKIKNEKPKSEND